jgi:6-phosphofructokinase 1
VNFLKRIGVVTSGGDAPGMNAVIRAIVRRAVPIGMSVVGFENGYSGLIADEKRNLDLRSVGGIINFGGTFLGSRRCPEFRTEEGLKKALGNLRKHRISDLIVIGGDGSLNGALELCKLDGVNVYGVPCSIDNDVYGTDETVGFDTAVNTALSAIDRIRDTATSHRRVFIVEVMGRKRGFLALSVGLAAGAEKILVPEVELDLKGVLELLEHNRKKGKKSSIIVAAEGVGDLRMITRQIRRKTGYEVRLSVLGYIQRGGPPTARSRILANLFGSEVVEMVESENKNRIVGLLKGRVCSTSLEEACEKKKPLDLDLLQLTEQLAT